MHFFVVLFGVHFMKLSVLLLFISATVLAVTHFLALEFYLYWQFVWFDVPMHILGGAVVGLTFFALRDLGAPVPAVVLQMPVLVLLVFLVGIIWEVFELVAGLYLAENYVFDTSIDLCMDIIGGCLAGIVGKRLHSIDS